MGQEFSAGPFPSAVTAGGGFTSKRGIFGKKEKQCTMLCVVFGRADGHAHTGGADGRVYHWEGNSLKKAIAGHSGPIFAMQAVEKVRPYPQSKRCSTLRR